MNDLQERELIDAAVRARQNAHAPYSNFKVGAAVFTTDGRIFTGCNVENVSYGLTVCAERNAIAAAVAAGVKGIEALVIVTDAQVAPAIPCGACRQVIAEFSKDLPILLYNASDGSIERLQLSELFPRPFTF